MNIYAWLSLIVILAAIVVFAFMAAVEITDWRWRRQATWPLRDGRRPAPWYRRGPWRWLDL